jgi:hypothetical protein
MNIAEVIQYINLTNKKKHPVFIERTKEPVLLINNNALLTFMIWCTLQLLLAKLFNTNYINEFKN